MKNVKNRDWWKIQFLSVINFRISFKSRSILTAEELNNSRLPHILCYQDIYTQHVLIKKRFEETKRNPHKLQTLTPIYKATEPKKTEKIKKAFSIYVNTNFEV